MVAATVFVTVKYFKSLNTSGVHAANVMRTIPDSAAAVFEFTNDKGFYDIFNDNSLLGSLAGDQNIADLDTVRKALLSHPVLQSVFDASNVYISLHPTTDNEPDLLLTAALNKDADPTAFDAAARQKIPGLLITPLTLADKKGYTIYFTSLKKRFYLINTEANIYSSSFSKALVEKAARYRPDKDRHAFLLLPDQQNSNSLANLYINYAHLSPLFGQLFRDQNTDLFKSFRLLPALAALNLNYRTDALMFNGYTNIEQGKPASYLNLFSRQAPIETHLKEIYPATVAYSMDMAVANPTTFLRDLTDFHDRAGLKKERDTLFKRIKTETGINLREEFNKLVGNEFAVVTTRYREKFALITIKDGSDLRPFMTNVSTMVNDDVGELNYNKLPYFLLGDAFNVFKRPYFRIVDNYLIFANSLKEINSYYDSYINTKFLTKTADYNRFDDLLAEKSNVAFFINFKNAQLILKNDLKPNTYKAYSSNKLSLKNFYAASYQFTAADNNFFTNFCIQKNPADSAASPKALKNSQ
ncbi:hypothetical protein DYU05_01455 [Mucilaginibacter terrenus]|uniref:DUF3352 domain-containing protein n=1 Tax=Mucilaginibacter terrenus TaxID=2482727 RepID=A0A3E2NTZ4_9SPHI|nr:hypothetical protein DYU05_01455 [Mucilaginibacter terrenus]